VPGIARFRKPWPETYSSLTPVRQALDTGAICHLDRALWPGALSAICFGEGRCCKGCFAVKPAPCSHLPSVCDVGAGWETLKARV